MLLIDVGVANCVRNVVSHPRCILVLACNIFRLR
jgi:hypothetical protein